MELHPSLFLLLQKQARFNMAAAPTDAEKVTAINRVLGMVRNIVPQTPKTETVIQVLCNLDYRLRQKGDITHKPKPKPAPYVLPKRNRDSKGHYIASDLQTVEKKWGQLS